MAQAAFPSVTPGRSTSATQGVFGVTMGTGVSWPAGTVIEHSIDGVMDSFTVDEDQGTSVVYFPYHDLDFGVHEWEGKVKFPDGSESILYPYTWEIVEAHTQVPKSAAVSIEGVIHGVGGVSAHADPGASPHTP